MVARSIYGQLCIQRKDGQLPHRTSPPSARKKIIIYRPEIVWVSLLYVVCYMRKIEYTYMMRLVQTVQAKDHTLWYPKIGQELWWYLALKKQLNAIVVFLMCSQTL